MFVGFDKIESHNSLVKPCALIPQVLLQVEYLTLVNNV